MGQHQISTFGSTLFLQLEQTTKPKATDIFQFLTVQHDGHVGTIHQRLQVLEELCGYGGVNPTCEDSIIGTIPFFNLDIHCSIFIKFQICLYKLHLQILLFSLQWGERIDDVYNQDIGGENDEVHQQTDAHEVTEAVASRAIDQHVGG